ncbi:MAG: HEAT repeat domain-containing protein [Planctomycetota bacterium]|jgi:hypothetical protein
MRRAGILLLLAGGALANPDVTAAHAIRDYNWTLVGRASYSIESIRDRLVPVMQSMSAKVAKSIRFQLDRGYKKKYKQTPEFLAVVSQILAAGGTNGIATLWRRYKAEGKRDQVRLGIAEALGGCGNDRALTTLLKIVFDKTPEVAAAAVRGCASYGKVKQDKRKAAVKKLVERYAKVYDQAAGKEPETVQAQMYQALKPTMNATLRAFTGQELDSAAAWKAWLGENLSRNWDE